MSNLTFYDRQRIEYLLNIKGFSIRKISRLINRDHSVISREVRRNKGMYLKYSAQSAQTIAKRHARNTNKRKLDKHKPLKDYVVSKLKLDWSPEQISGRLKHHPPSSLVSQYICPETIYQYIYEVDAHLYHLLRRKHYNRLKQYSRKSQKKINIPDRVSIHKRDVMVNLRQRYGDWETDLMEFSKQKNTLSVDIDRKSRLVRIHKLNDKSSEQKLDALIQTLADLPPSLIRTMTFDNGTENVKHTKIKKDYDIKTYFCDPYSSWQKGAVENTNGLLRQYFPRKIKLNKIPHTLIYQIQEKLNNRPRKALNYQTPNEIIKEQVVH